MKIELLFLTHNRLGVVSRCLRSIIPALPENVHIHLWDNASTDGTAPWLLKLAKRYPRLRVTLSAQNLGVALARIEQLKQVTGEVIGILDSDVESLHPVFIPRLVEALEIPGVGIVGQGGHVLTESYAYRSMPLDYSGEVDYLSGFCQFFKREVLEKGAMIDPAFARGGAEDDDFVFQVKALGLKAWMVGDLPLKHIFSGTWDGAQYQQNRKLWRDKWAGKGLAMFERNAA